MNITLLLMDVLYLHEESEQIILCYRGLKYNAAYFHVIWQNGEKATPFHLIEQDKLCIGYEDNAIEISILGYNENACTLICDVPDHIVIKQSQGINGKLDSLSLNRIGEASQLLIAQSKLLLQQQYDENEKNTEYAQTLLSHFQEMVDGIKLDIKASAKKKELLDNLLEKFA